MKDLSQYRRKPIESRLAAPREEASEAEGYVAFNAKDHAMRIQFRSANEATYSCPYLLLPIVVFDGEYGTSFVVMVRNLNVHVRGNNLQPVIAAIEMGTAAFIQEFDPDRWTKPSDPTAPFIESLKIEAIEMASLIGKAAPAKAGPRPH